MKKIYSTLNKRTFDRFKVNFPFEIRGEDFCYETELKDISCNGLFCRSTHYIAPKTRLKVILGIPLCVDQKIERRTFICQGQVVRIDPEKQREGAHYSLGISFAEISKLEKDLILRFIRQRNIKESEELRDMYNELKQTIAYLEALEESHPGAEHFCQVISHAILELDDVANTLDYEITQIRQAS